MHRSLTNGTPALSIAEYEQGLTAAGFVDVEITPPRIFDSLAAFTRSDSLEYCWTSSEMLWPTAVFSHGTLNLDW